MIQSNNERSEYVILTAKPSGWFVPGTEVFHYTEPRRITLAEYNQAVEDGSIGCRGERIREFMSESDQVPIGESYEDGEWCFLEEFDMQLTSKPLG